MTLKPGKNILELSKLWHVDPESPLRIHSSVFAEEDWSIKYIDKFLKCFTSDVTNIPPSEEAVLW